MRSTPKYSHNPINEYLHALTMESGHDEETGSTQELGWFGLFQGPVIDPAAMDVQTNPELTAEEIEQLQQCAGAIVTEDSNGFVSATIYTSADELNKDWQRIDAQYDEYYDGGLEDRDESHEDNE
jgi:hypothetical protein